MSEEGLKDKKNQASPNKRKMFQSTLPKKRKGKQHGLFLEKKKAIFHHKGQNIASNQVDVGVNNAV